MKVNHGRMREDEARKYFQQLINAVDYCHSRGVFHRDLKVLNITLRTFNPQLSSEFMSACGLIKFHFFSTFSGAA